MNTNGPAPRALCFPTARRSDIRKAHASIASSARKSSTLWCDANGALRYAGALSDSHRTRVPMLTTLAIANYRSLRDLAVPMGSLNLVTGANGSGKSNLYRALRLLAETAQGGVVPALAREGGLQRRCGRGRRTSTRAHARACSGGRRRAPGGGIAAAWGSPARTWLWRSIWGCHRRRAPPVGVFADPEIKREVIWGGPFLRSAMRSRSPRTDGAARVAAAGASLRAPGHVRQHLRLDRHPRARRKC